MELSANPLEFSSFRSPPCGIQIKPRWSKHQGAPMKAGWACWDTAFLTGCLLQFLLVHLAAVAGIKSPEDCAGPIVMVNSILGWIYLSSSYLTGKLRIWAEMFWGCMGSFDQIEVIKVWKTVEATYRLLLFNCLSFVYYSI